MDNKKNKKAINKVKIKKKELQVHQKETLVYEEELREAQDKKEKPQVIKDLNMKLYWCSIKNYKIE